MSKSLKKIKEQIEKLKKKNPVYAEILDFYEKVLEKQLQMTPSLTVTQIESRDDIKKIQTQEGFPLMNKEDFTLDIPSSVLLFNSLCEIGKTVTPKMNEDIQRIEYAIADNNLHLDKLFIKHFDKAYQEKIAEKLQINNVILKFLVYMSIQPSIAANVEKVKDQVDLKNWLRGYCPVCGSLPKISALTGDTGNRHFMCSFCNFLWSGERLKCPFCDNRDHKKLHYFYADGQEAYRVDLCEQCKKYIKTIDVRKLTYKPDLNLEDITSLHLDMLASEKGFKRPVPSLWGI
ncbi:MAG: hypothetical protein A2Y97_13050 [Nitrospirae bacterium RBG_13_39_12]|nr:MAG: hypothetical protein A2Y97_13050 [Nitrospirae bacterium RBG_13_39_12]